MFPDPSSTWSSPVVGGRPVVDEDARLAALRRLDVLDTAREVQFDKIVSLVRTLLDVPIAAVTLVDAHRQWFKAEQGLGCQQTPRGGSFCTHTITQSGPLVIADALLDPRVANSPLVWGAPFIRAYAGVPLVTPDGHAVGALCAIDTRPRSFTAMQIEMLKGFAELVVHELELRQIVATDQLTGAMSRRGFLAAVEQELERVHRYGRTAALAVLDVDHFKTVNDRHGHPAGDSVLRELADRCDTVLRTGDAFGRIGGEEFAVLLPETHRAGAELAVERLRESIAGVPFTLCDGEGLTVTASFGIAPAERDPGPEAWLARADACLYRAKQAGRNRWVTAPEAAPPVARAAG